MEVITKDNLLREYSKVTVYISLQTYKKRIRDSSKKLTWMALALKSGMMEEFSPDSSSEGAEMAKVL